VQGRLVARLKAGVARGDASSGGTLLLLEHPPTFTTGLRSMVYSAQEEQRLTALGAEFVRTNRGGLITFHGPGQLVAYPVLDLRQFVPQEARRKALLGMKWYVWTLEQMVIDLLASEYGVEGERSPHTGVWVRTKGKHETSKICAMGVHNSDMVTSHGLALNCTTDMSWFDQIVPCGITGAGVTSLAELLGRTGDQEERAGDYSVERAGDLLESHFQRAFSCDTRPLAAAELLEGL
jgi:lipoyl(octanoyl) transferase